MKDESFYNKAWKFTKKVLKDKSFYFAALKLSITVLFFLLLVFISAKLVQAVVDSFGAIWNDRSLIQSEQPLQLAIGLLTVLVTIIAIVVGAVTWLTRREWYKFKEDIWKDADRRLKDLEESQEEIKYLKKHIETDPLLLHPEDRKQLFDFADGIRSGQDMLALKYYFAGRAYEIGYEPNISKEKQLEKSVLYYKRALEYDPRSKTKRRICQAMGFSLSELGKAYSAENQPKAKKCYENAVKAFKDAYEAEHSSQALDSQGNAYIELAKMASDNHEEKTNQLNEAIKYFDAAIQMKDKLAQQWWATYHFDKARALALRAAKDNREDLDEVVKELERTINAIDKEPVGFNVPELFQDFEDIRHESEIKRLLDLLQEVKVKAMPKGD